MQTPVKCKNCGLKWARVVPFGDSIVYDWDIQLVCPKCGSNWFEPITEDEPDAERLSEDEPDAERLSKALGERQ